jgi:small-conductance mechanosensitive channel
MLSYLDVFRSLPVRRTASLACFAAGLLLARPGAVVAQPNQPPSTQPASSSEPPTIASAVNAEPTDEQSTLTFFNRPIIVLRARVLGRRPSERAATTERVLDELVEEGITSPVTKQVFAGASIISVRSRAVLVLTALDVDQLSGQTLERVTDESVRRLEQALNEAAEARAPGILLRSAVASTAVIIVAVLVVWGLARVHRVVDARLLALAEQKVTKAGIARLEALRSSRVLDFQHHALTALIMAADLVVIYTATSYVLKHFPYTRPWGESMRGFLLATLENFALGVLDALPGLFTVFLIFVIVRFVVRLVRLWFDAVERGQVASRWLYPDTALPTRRLVTILLWLFAIVVAYPYLPGSQTDAFKGVSVFLGVMVTFGSSGIMNQIMSGFMVTYSRALRVGDFVRIGDIEGTVIQMGVLSTKVRTLQREEVTVPNAVVVSQTTTDYSRLGDTEGIFTPTSVTIGYNTPWRQVHSLLLMAAERTPGLRPQPKPWVIQSGLEDFYVKYTLFVSLGRQDSRLDVLNALHANIQDLFNEYGVQIMSPNYMIDPAAPKIVPKEDWFAAPAKPEPPRTES